MRKACSYLIAILAFCGVAQAQTTESVTDRLNAVKGEMEKIEARYQEVSAKRDANRTEATALKTKLKTLDTDISKLSKKVDALAKDKEHAGREVEQQKKRLAYLRQQSESRLKVIYMFQDIGVERGVLLRTSSGDLERNSVYLRKMREFDTQLMESLRKVADSLTLKETELAKLTAEQEQSREALNTKRQETQSSLDRVAKLAKELEAEIKAADQARLELKKQATELERLISELMGEGPDVPSENPENQEQEEEVAPVDTPQASSDASLVNPEKPAEEPVNPAQNGLFAKGIKITAPVSARITRGFGKVKEDEIGGIVFNKGVWFNTQAGENVLSVADGKVAYVGQMPRFGIVVVIDHGLRSYSLYGQLGVSLVSTGQAIKGGAVVGKTGMNSGPNPQNDLYFEIRRNGQPVNPDIILKGK